MKGKIRFKQKTQFIPTLLSTDFTQMFFGFLVVNHLGDMNCRRTLFTLLAQHLYSPSNRFFSLPVPPFSFRGNTVLFNPPGKELITLREENARAGYPLLFPVIPSTPPG